MKYKGATSDTIPIIINNLPIFNDFNTKIADFCPHVLPLLFCCQRGTSLRPDGFQLQTMPVNLTRVLFVCGAGEGAMILSLLTFCQYVLKALDLQINAN